MDTKTHVTKFSRLILALMIIVSAIGPLFTAPSVAHADYYFELSSMGSQVISLTGPAGGECSGECTYLDFTFPSNASTWWLVGWVVTCDGCDEVKYTTTTDDPDYLFSFDSSAVYYGPHYHCFDAFAGNTACNWAESQIISDTWQTEPVGGGYLGTDYHYYPANHNYHSAMYFGCDACDEGEFPMDVTVRYWAIWFIEDMTPTPTSPPTNTPTPTVGTPTATYFPTSAAPCITAAATATRTPARTPTPFSLTPHPTSTRGPTATPGTGAGFSDAELFSDGLGKWTVYQPNPFFGSVRWLSDTVGNDPPFLGVAYMENLGISLGGSAPLTMTGDISNTLIYSVHSMDFPIRLGGFLKWSGTLFANEQVLVSPMILYGTTWIATSFTGNSVRVGTFWNQFSVVIRKPTWLPDTAKARAVGLFYHIDENHVHTGQGLLLNNLTIATGQMANSGVGLPQCAGTGAVTAGGSTNPRNQPPKVCRITWTMVDVYGDCVTPQSFWDISNWLSYWMCRLWDFLKFGKFNLQQLNDMNARQGINEPFGTMQELVTATWATYESVAAILDSYHTDHFFGAFDWNSIMNLSALDTPPSITAATPEDQSYLTQCNALILDTSVIAQRSACLVVDFVVNKSAFIFFMQWMLNFAAIGRLIGYVQTRWWV